MNSMPTPKPSDDPHDILVIAPDAVRVAPADEEIESLLKDKARAASATQPAPSAPPVHVEPLFPAEATVSPIDRTIRVTAGDDVPVKPRRTSLARRVLRAVAALLLAACIGGAAMAWHYHAEAAQRIIAEWAPLFVQKSSQPSEKTGLAAPTVLAAAEVDAANTSPAQPATQTAAAAQTAVSPAAEQAAAAPTAAETAAPAGVISPDEPQSLEAMARDLASASQQIEQLKASVEQLKASQQQLVAMISEKEKAAQNLRPKKPASPPRPVAALAPARPAVAGAPPRPLRPPPPPIATSAAAAPLPPAAPYVPRQVEPSSHTATELNDPELVYVPRPPMPLR